MKYGHQVVGETERMYALLFFGCCSGGPGWSVASLVPARRAAEDLTPHRWRGSSTLH